MAQTLVGRCSECGAIRYAALLDGWPVDMSRSAALVYAVITDEEVRQGQWTHADTCSKRKAAA